MTTITLHELERFGAAEASSPAELCATDAYDDTDFSAGRGDWAGVLAGCLFAQASSDPSNARSLPEPHWYALASLLSRCEDGQAIFRKISAQDEIRYDQAEADRKFDQAATASAPRTCRSIHEDLGFDGCRQCTFWRHA